MNTDTIADFLTRIRNAIRANHRIVDIPSSNIKKEITKVLHDKGFISNYKFEKEGQWVWKRFPEALAVYNINRMDAQIDIMNRVIKNAGNGDIENGWTSEYHHFKTSLFVE